MIRIAEIARQSQPSLPQAEPALPKPRDQLVTEIDLRKEREHAARDARIAACYAQLDNWYEYAVESLGDECPNSYDARRIWDDLVWASDACAPFNEDVIMSDAELAGVEQSLENYPQCVVRSLEKTLNAFKVRLEEEAGGEDGSEHEDAMKRGRKGKGKLEQKHPRPQDPQTAVDRSTALFQCAKCGDSGYAWPEINVHWRERHPDESVWDEAGEFKAEVWEGVEVAERVLAALVEQGLGMRSKGRMQLDDLIGDGRVFCACRDLRMVAPSEGSNWVALVSSWVLYANYEDAHLG